MRTRRVITVVGCHAGGEIGNVVVGGVLPPAGATVFEQMQTLQREGDWLRKLLLREPRGSVACHANLVVPATRAGLRRGLHHHGADRVSGHVRLEHDLHDDRPARDRHARAARAGDGRPAGGAGRRRRGACGVPRRSLRERRVHERRLLRRPPRRAARGGGDRHGRRRRRLRRHVVRDRRRQRARLRDRAARGARPLARGRADPGRGARAASVRRIRRTRRSRASASSSSPSRGRASAR